jgi:hypothetical protein
VDAVIAELRSREHNCLNRAANEAATGLTDRLSARRARVHSHRRLPRLFRTVRNQPAHDRIRILMTLFGGPRPVEFAAGDIVKV